MIPIRINTKETDNRDQTPTIPQNKNSKQNETSMFVKTSKFMIKWTCEFHMTLNEKMIII